MATGYHDFTAGETLTAANLEDYCHLQGIMTFASAAARNAALAAVLREGLFAYLQDSNTVTVYSGAAWSTVGPVHGGWLSHTPAVTQSGAVAITVNNSTYCRQGRRIEWRFTVSVTGSGTAANLVTLSLPVNINYVSDFAPCGHTQLYDVSVPTLFLGAAVPAAAGTIKIQSTYSSAGAAPAFLGTSTFTAGLANGDIISGWVIYEAAADA